MHIRPFAGKLIAQPIAQASHSPGGIEIPEAYRTDLKSQFTVLSVGKGKVVRLKNGTFLRLMPEVRSSDRIIANTFAGKEITVDGRPCRLMDQSSVLALIEGCPTGEVCPEGTRVPP